MPVDDPHQFSDRLQRLLSEDIPDLPHPEDKRLLRTYIKKLRKSQSEGTVYNNAMRVQTIIQHLDTPFVDADEYAIEEVIDDLKAERDWTDGTARNYGKAARAVIKRVQKKTKKDWEFAADHKYIELDADESGGKITEDDVFSREQVRILVEETARNQRDRALYGLLIDLGLRIGAICSLRVGDFSHTQGDEVGTIQLNPEAIGTKGAEGRTQVTTWSTPYIRRYLNGDHPRPDDENAPLLHKQSWDENDPADDGSFTPPVVRLRLRRLTEDYDEIPPEFVNPHTFRHTAVTLWAKRGLSDREITHRAGWARESGQLERYEHLTDKDINNEILRTHGIEPSEETTPLLSKCPSCGMKVEPIMTYCGDCGQNLDIIREKPDWFHDLRDEVGEDDALVQYFIENPHELTEDIHDLPMRLHERLQDRLEAHIEQTDDAVVGGSFIDMSAPEDQVLRELADARDDFELPDRVNENPEDDVPEGPGTFRIVDDDAGEVTEVTVPMEEVHDILDEIAEIDWLTDTELVAYDESGSALRVISILDELTRSTE